MADDLKEKGFRIRAQLFGEAGARERIADFERFDEGFGRLVNEQVFGGIWARPGLPIKTRSMITMAALIALGRGAELRVHMRGALNLGITHTELKEMIFHLSQYSGVPSAVEAIRAFTEVT